MFPENLDGAKVLYYTQQDCYGETKLPNGEIADKYCYLVICKYSDDESYYLFCCNENYEVVSDSVWGSADECMNIAASSYKENILWIEKDE